MGALGRVGDKRSSLTPRSDEEAASFGTQPQLIDSMLPRKASSGDRVVTVPETDTGGWGEYPKALERTQVKELGKLTP